MHFRSGSPGAPRRSCAAGGELAYLKGSTFPAIWLTEQDSVELSGGQMMFMSRTREGVAAPRCYGAIPA